MSSMFPVEWKLAGFDIGAVDMMLVRNAFSPIKSMYKIIQMCSAAAAAASAIANPQNVCQSNLSFSTLMSFCLLLFF